MPVISLLCAWPLGLAVPGSMGEHALDVILNAKAAILQAAERVIMLPLGCELSPFVRRRDTVAVNLD